MPAGASLDRIRRTVASRKTLSADNLETLGARRLAELLMDVAKQDARTARRLRLELAADTRRAGLRRT